MNAVLELVGREQPWRRAEAKVGRSHDHHFQVHTQPLGNDVDDLRLAAVTVEDHHFTKAGPRDRVADLAPQADQGFGRCRECARKVAMFQAVADRLGRQDQHRDIVWHPLQHSTHDAITDGGVGAERQVRAMLLNRSDRQ